jgi:hypothetical protein
MPDASSEFSPVPPPFVPPAGNVRAAALFGRALSSRLGFGAAFVSESVERMSWALQRLADEGRIPLRSAIGSIDAELSGMRRRGGVAFAGSPYVGNEAVRRLVAILACAESEAAARGLSREGLLDAFAILAECETSGRTLPPLPEALTRVAAMIGKMSLAT